MGNILKFVKELHRKYKKEFESKKVSKDLSINYKKYLYGEKRKSLDVDFAKLATLP